MPIVGFGFNKINVEKKETSKQFKIQNNINVSGVKDFKMIIGSDEKLALKAFFDYTVDYEEAGKLSMSGHVIYFDTETKIKELLNSWKKDEKLPPDVGALIYNFIIHKATIKAVELESDMGLPLHLNLPKILPKKKE